ncbi:MAG TPA: hypothetical protein VMJ93_13555 [Verrucomicrobiae bacterium]|nr:hypothetical protein [Verrucomicrobiae bacterium]
MVPLTEGAVNIKNEQKHARPWLFSPVGKLQQELPQSLETQATRGREKPVLARSSPPKIVVVLSELFLAFDWICPVDFL